jgi:hypothetical protein
VNQSRPAVLESIEKTVTWLEEVADASRELLKLGFEVSERTVSRWIKRATNNPDPARRWLVFLRNHREAIAAMDFCTA